MKYLILIHSNAPTSNSAGRRLATPNARTSVEGTSHCPMILRRPAS